MQLNLKKSFYINNRPFLIAGPCSVESEEQIFHVAKDLAKRTPLILLRGGIWKPRTRPNSFEGIGQIGLPWLVNAGRNVGIPVTTEVANAKHVELALKAEIDVLWIGARTTANPFAVQDIATALKGVEITVMVKNPINPDLQLWIGAFERLMNAGVEDLIAIHRGFSVYNHPHYRNAPNWQIPIALMEEMPYLPIICDPSHISGKSENLLKISQKAMDLNFDGLMIETHPNPQKAWSDSEQQITPKVLSELMASLVLRKHSLKEESSDFLEEKRQEIKQLDDKIFGLLEDRMDIVHEIGEFKREKGITILQTEHWKKMIEERMIFAQKSHLTKEFLRSVLDAIHQESIRHQTKVMNPE